MHPECRMARFLMCPTCMSGPPPRLGAEPPHPPTLEGGAPVCMQRIHQEAERRARLSSDLHCCLLGVQQVGGACFPSGPPGPRPQPVHPGGRRPVRTSEAVLALARVLPHRDNRSHESGGSPLQLALSCHLGSLSLSLLRQRRAWSHLFATTGACR